MAMLQASQGYQPAQRHETWFAVQVQPRREKLASMHLERQDYRVFAPRIKRFARRSGRAVEVTEALFPGYVFVALDRNWDSWRSINGTIGVSRLVMFGDEPATLPPDFVETLFDSADTQGVVAFDTDLKAGDPVRIIGGAFDNITGTLLSADRNARVMILVHLLSGPRRMSIDRGSLIAG